MEWRLAVAFILAAVSAALTSTTVNGAPPIFTNPLVDQRGVEHGIAAFVCSATGVLPLHFNWQKDGKRAKGSRITQEDIENGSVLRIDLLRTPRDQGMYTCVVTDGNSEEARTEAQLTVYEEGSLPAGFPSIARSTQVQVVERYRQGQLTCSASGNPVPEIAWYRNNLPLQPSGRLSVVGQAPMSDTVSEVLTIERSEKSDEGSYRCVATNTAGTRFSEATNLYVRVRSTPPVITLINETIEVLPGSTFKIHCVAAGSPMPVVRWQVEGIQVGDEDEEPKIGVNTYTVEDIQESVNYTCLATSTGGLDERKLEVIVKTRPGPPAPPEVGLVTATTISLTWAPPGRVAMNSYVLMYKEASSTGSFEEVTEISQQGYTVENLEPYTEYIFQVAAVNAIGRGRPSTETRERTGELAPATAPREVSARPISASTIFIRWAPPRKPNGVIQGYNVYYTTRPSQGLSAWFKHSVSGDSERVTTISDLTTMQIYTISVSAYTSVGEGPASDHIQVKTQQGVPGQPENFAGQAISATEIQLTWTMRDNVQITRYELYYNTSSSGSEEQYRAISPSNSFILNNLSPNTLYHIRLAASSTNGVGASTSVISIRTEQSVPSEPPRDIVGTAVDSTSLRVTWNPPSEENQNGVLIAYKISYTKISLGNAVPFDDQTAMIVEVDSAERTHDIENLEKWTVYELKMAAATIKGDGPWSTPISAQTDEDVPEGPPTTVRVSAINSTTVHVQWSPPLQSLQNGVIRGYQIHYGLVDENNEAVGRVHAVWVQLGTITEAWLTDLHHKSRYSVEVVAYTLKGDGLQSRVQYVQTPGEVPGVPDNFEVIESDDGVYVASWMEPGVTHGEILGYNFTYGPSDAEKETVNLLPAQRSYEIPELLRGVNYVFHLSASNDEGTGEDAHFKLAIPEDRPSGVPLRMLAEAVSSDMITVSWEPPLYEERNGVISGYTVRMYAGDPTQSITNRTSATSLTFSGLRPNTDYVVQVKAHTSVGGGPFTEEFMVRTPPESPSTPPRDVTAVSSGDSSIEVSWKAPENIKEHATGYSYVIYYTSDSSRTDVSNWPTAPVGITMRYELEDLREKTRYALAVQLQTPHGNSAISGIVYSTTQPAAPRDFTAEILINNEVRLTWKPPRGHSRDLGYVITYSTTKGFKLLNPGYYDNGKVEVDSGRKELALTILQPNMDYEFNITAKTPDDGVTPSSTIYIKTNVAPPKSVPKLEMENAVVTESTVKITMPSIPQSGGPLDHILIIVVPLAGGPGQASIPSRSPDSYTYEELLSQSITPGKRRRSAEARPPYITAKLMGSDIPDSFKIGDSQVVNGFTNKPLDNGQSYSFFTRATVMSENQTPLHSTSKYSEVVTTGPNPNKVGEKGDNSFTGADPSPSQNQLMVIIIAGGIGILILLLLVVLVYMLLIRRSSSTATPKRPDEPLNNQHVDPVELRRIHHQTPAMMSHPPIPITELSDHIERLKGNDNFLFSQEYESIEPGQQFTWEHSNLETNKPKNRYANVIAYDHSRVILASVEDIPESDYINANYCDGYRKQNAYIATQGPLPETLADFWRMVWEQRSVTIVMMTKLEERNRVKCDQYWPSRGQEIYGHIQVALLDVTELASYTVRTFALVNLKSRSTEKREVRQFQFTAWPDHGVPEHATSVLAFVNRVKACNPPDAGPMVVHCSAGVGRAGAYIVIDSMLERVKHEQTVDIYGHVTCLRAQRNYMVQTEEQYIFIHESLLEAVQSGNTEVPARNLYAHIQKLSQPDPGDSVTDMESEFKRLANIKAQPSQFVSASLPANKFKNRLVNILPFEQSRVYLQPIRGVEGSDYINASHIHGYRQRNAFIATQGPLAETTEDFWRMLWDQNSTIVVMLTKLREMNRDKCHQYWPAERSARYQYFVVDPMSEYNMPQYVLREFKVTDARDGQSRTIRQFQFTEWPEQGVPKSGEGFIDFIGQVLKTKDQFGQDGPVTVHCSSGVGRTGVFVTLSIVLERMKYEGVVDIFQTVKMLRTQRPAMVQTEDQYQFCYKAALEYLGSFDHYT
ncbi:receptor-type tyrosine-protein phosphatase delta-like isoform X2 [Apostichopus japonicus]|uniref:receptor-type tyrosine-protein phosphatase delta-like isoform X2 n=1 Tax=Stichopus japonicus TaxID=307972 RepID=UPI003AB4094C